MVQVLPISCGPVHKIMVICLTAKRLKADSALAADRGLTCVDYMNLPS
jgi:hypothetical protein